MLYLDSSALMKRYVIEKGSRSMTARFERGENIYTSLLSFGEIHTALARAFRMGRLSAQDLHSSREAFLNDWLFGMTAIEVSTQTMTALPGLVENYLLKAADAVHLSTAIWLRDRFRFGGRQSFPKNEVEFGVADTQLSQAAEKCGLLIFNPELLD